MLGFEILLTILAIAVTIPAVVVFAQVLLALPADRRPRVAEGPRPRIAVLVPAHDEALVIGRTLDAIRPQLLATDRLVVVADNCGDDTCKLARASGAEVMERFDEKQRGKGYALDFGVRHLQADPPEVLVIFDADCDADAHAVDRIARLCRESGRPVQALYLMHTPPDARLGQRVTEFAWLVKNHVRPLGSHRAGAPCQLTGTGMAFPWSALRHVSLATGHITEDMLLGVELAEAGAPPLFCPEALVTSQFAASSGGAQSQRRRWEHGHLGLILARAPRLLWRGLARRDLRLVGMALDLAVPPIAMLVLLLLGVLFLGMALKYFGGAAGPVWIASAGLGLLALAVGLAWVRFGRGVISLWQLAYAPIYALGKLPLYLAFIVKRQTDWVRTRRDG